MKLSPASSQVPSPEKVLRRMFLTVFMRGHSARGLTKQTTPKSVASKLKLYLLLFGSFGFFSCLLLGQPTLVLSLSLHALTFFLIGWIIVSSAGEMLFNKEEAEILMHRPVTARMLLRAKAEVLVLISLYMAAAFNFAGLFVGIWARDGNRLFPLAHLVSTFEQTLFCVGVVVLGYQICLRWIGRERLEGVMTTLQVVLILSITVGSQVLGQAVSAFFISGGGKDLDPFRLWWVKLLPPAWFSALDDALTGSHRQSSWLLAGLGVLATAAVVWLAFVRLASVYESGSQALYEAARLKPKGRTSRRLLKTLSENAPLVWFLPNPVSRVSFQLVGAYLARDRDTKLRIYPSITPSLVMPVMLLFMNGQTAASDQRMAAIYAQYPKMPHDSGVSPWIGNFFIAMSAAYVCLDPLTILTVLRYSQHWRAGDVFVASPLKGPAPLLQGARVAAVFFFCVPLLVLLVIFAVWTQGFAALRMLLPAVFALPVYAMIPGALIDATPLSTPTEEARGASNVLITLGSMAAVFVIVGLAMGAAALGLLPYFLIFEAAVSAALCMWFNSLATKRTWRVYD